jgi:DNA-binding IclR family transcriptional regulator
VDQARSNGYSVDVDCYILGVTVVSAPIVRDNGVSNLLVVVGLSERLNGKIDVIGRELVAQADRLARRMDG